MSKTSTDLIRHALNGPTMGTRWSALFFTPPGFDRQTGAGRAAAAVDVVDAHMSTWKPDSDLMRLNRPRWAMSVVVPADLAHVLALGMPSAAPRAGLLTSAWAMPCAPGASARKAADVQGIRTAMAASRRPAHEVLELEGTQVRKRGLIALDLNGIAKGYGVDSLAATLRSFGIDAALVGIDGEMRAQGLRPDGEAWTIAIEAPDTDRRAPHAILNLQDAAVATSGDYRHWVTVEGRQLSHTMDPRRGAPLLSSPASVTVIAPSCAEADAWATALMVVGPEAGAALAARQGLSALFLLRDDAGGVRAQGCGHLFADSPGNPSVD
jgi:thiamine biosynthesis lipoprotein